MIPLFLRYLILLPLIIVISAFPQSGAKKDFLVVENPSALTIFNKFEQTITESRKKAFPSFTPFLILNNNEKLSDGFTGVVRTNFRGEEYLVLLDIKGLSSGNKSENGVYLFENTSLLNDSVQMLKDKIVERIFPENKKIEFKKGQIFSRIFSDKKGTMILDPYGKYGFYKLENLKEKSDFNKLLVDKIADNGLDEVIISEIKSTVNSFNSTLKNINEYISDKRGITKEVPRFNINEEPNLLRITLEPIASAKLFSRTQNSLLSEIRLLLIGRKITLNERGNTIIISAESKK
ncbi:MAG: hypothetical protein IAE91_04585 [Ignavibacteriaceae bacterium]|nr:hypothetical protein [Ignavibacteriaceae bacterium]